MPSHPVSGPGRVPETQPPPQGWAPQTPSPCLGVLFPSPPGPHLLRGFGASAQAMRDLCLPDTATRPGPDLVGLTGPVACPVWGPGARCLPQADPGAGWRALGEQAGAGVSRPPPARDGTASPSCRVVIPVTQPRQGGPRGPGLHGPLPQHPTSRACGPLLSQGRLGLSLTPQVRFDRWPPRGTFSRDPGASGTNTGTHFLRQRPLPLDRGPRQAAGRPEAVPGAKARVPPGSPGVESCSEQSRRGAPRSS